MTMLDVEFSWGIGYFDLPVIYQATPPLLLLKNRKLVVSEKSCFTHTAVVFLLIAGTQLTHAKLRVPIRIAAPSLIGQAARPLSIKRRLPA